MINKTESQNSVRVIRKDYVEVQWVTTITEDGVPIAPETYRRCTYTEYDYDRFLAEVEDAQGIIDMMGWVPGKKPPDPQL